MIEITVDCNMDKVVIKSDSYREEFEYDARYPTQVLKILEEVINHISEDKETLGVKLLKIDEDNCGLIQEW